MKKLSLLSLLLLAVLLSFGQDIEYYISPNGDDNNTGTLSTPFQTLERARDEIRTLSNPGNITVWLMDGEYYRNSTFELTAQDSGSDGANITYAALNKHGAIIHLNKSVPTEDFTPLIDPALIARLTPEALGNVVQLDLAALGIQNADVWSDYFPASNQDLFRLYADTDELPLSRYPNDTMMTMKRVLQNEPGIFEYRGNRHSRWLEAVNEGLWFQGYWRVVWQFDAVRTASIDTLARTVTQVTSVPGGIGSKYHRPEGSGEEPYFALNLIDEIDIPGEWAINFNTQMLYIWIPDGVSEIKILDNDTPLFKLTDVSHVNILNLKFDYGLGSAIEIDEGNDNLVAGCEITNFIEDAIRVVNGTGHEIVSNDMHHLGAGGIYLSGGDRLSLTPSQHRAVNNHIYEFARIKVIYAPAINTFGVGNYVAHNKMHGTPHVGVLVNGNNHIFEYNEIYDICRVSNDMGAFYSWNDWSSYGNIYRYNYIHDAPQAHGTYFDDGDSGDIVYNNVMQNIHSAIFIGGGHDNIVYNNLAVNCAKTVHIDNRGVSRGYNLDNNKLVNQLLSVNYQNPPWSDQYPTIVSVLDSTYAQELPTGCSVYCNVGINTPTVVDINAQTATDWGVDLGTNYSDTDANLANASLVEIAAACAHNGEFCIGLVPYSEIGLISDEYRTVDENPMNPICDDNDDCTTSDQYDANCDCVGILQDNDNNGVCDNCIDIQLKVWLEGAYDPALDEMTSTLSSARRLLPGQTPNSPLVIPTPAGQPYHIAPWNYSGAEGTSWTDVDYNGNETDWILVSFRTGIAKNTEVAMTSGLLMKDGVIEFPNRCALSSSISEPLYIVLEHRNHIGIMTSQPIDIVSGILSYDFRSTDSYRDATSFGQKQLSNGEWAMFAGDADQFDFPSYDIQGTDKTIWFENNGIFDYYFSPDFNLDGDINGQDKSLWFENNGISSRVPK